MTTDATTGTGGPRPQPRTGPPAFRGGVGTVADGDPPVRTDHARPVVDCGLFQGTAAVPRPGERVLVR
ncbi:hypothetical protein OH807_38610 [Kitasatospora sp. NBC_01560]|uniref:hypothetical protein n=1 Tax=Kitasatospora sp. NBC_01560 TaxID=2975965 RepID=UPI0038631378